MESEIENFEGCLQKLGLAKSQTFEENDNQNEF